MNSELAVLTLTAATVGFIHTLVEPDHYVPFVALARARRWSTPWTAWITVACGFGHVLGSVVLGTIGIAFGLTLARLEWIDSYRGDLAAWLLISFGLIYFAWGLRRATRPHAHWHAHGHALHRHHHHDHGEETKSSLTPWALFLVFVLGPCEPLIPILMYPAATESWLGAVVVTAVFAIATIGTMVAIVLLGLAGVKLFDFGRLERFSHAAAGATIALCGVGIQFLGL
ncbi:MAG: sulfite exporter TauE/SafE family protein [Acidobacteriota bacterium]|nr:MAG: sulfite exporter TauE/SafE family protein [Acidobacteriota bacterium]